MKILTALSLSFLILNASHARADDTADLLELGINPDQEIGLLTNPAADGDLNDLGDDQIVEVKTSALKLAGRGFADRDSHESIAIACVGEELKCDKLRFVYFNPQTKKAFYVGSLMTVNEYVPSKKAARMNDDQQRQYATKQIMKNFRSWRRSHHGLSESTKSNITAGSFMVVVAAGGAASVLGTAGLSLAVGIASYPFYLLLTPIITGDIKLMNGNQKITDASYDQNGWNWSSEPAQIRGKVFNQMFEYLTQYRNTTLNLREGIHQQ